MDLSSQADWASCVTRVVHNLIKMFIFRRIDQNGNRGAACRPSASPPHTASSWSTAQRHHFRLRLRRPHPLYRMVRFKPSSSGVPLRDAGPFSGGFMVIKTDWDRLWASQKHRWKALVQGFLAHLFAPESEQTTGRFWGVSKCFSRLRETQMGTGGPS